MLYVLTMTVLVTERHVCLNHDCIVDTETCCMFLVHGYVYSKQPIVGLTQELSFSRLECGVHDKLHISSAVWWDILLPLA